MGEVITIGLDIAKSVFQIHGVDADGVVTVCKRVSRSKVLGFFGGLPPCLVGIEACPTAHYWGRELQALGHTVKLMPPSYVKAYLKRSKNDANDAAAICEAVTRPTMRFVPIKTKEQQAALMLHRTRQLLVRQRTMVSNAIRGHLAELGIVSAKGRNGTSELLGIIADAADNSVPPNRPQYFSMCWRGIVDRRPRSSDRINRSKSILASASLVQEASRRLEGDPGNRSDRRYGSDCSRSATGRRSHRDAVLPHRSVGAEAAHDRRQGQAWWHHQQGNRYLRWLLVTGAMAVIRYAQRHGTQKRPWLGRIAGTPTDEGGCRRARQQDCTDGVGHHGIRGERYKEPEAVACNVINVSR